MQVANRLVVSNFFFDFFVGLRKTVLFGGFVYLYLEKNLTINNS